MNGKGLVAGVVCRRRLQPTDIGSVAELRLSVTPEDLILLRTFEEDFVLLGSSLLTESDLTESAITRPD